MRKKMMLNSAYRNVGRHSLGCGTTFGWAVYGARRPLPCTVIRMNRHIGLELSFGATCWVLLVVISLFYRVLVTWVCTQLYINIIFLSAKKKQQVRLVSPIPHNFSLFTPSQNTLPTSTTMFFLTSTVFFSANLAVIHHCFLCRHRRYYFNPASICHVFY